MNINFYDVHIFKDDIGIIFQYNSIQYKKKLNVR
jgi:hypothetical protein